MADLTTSTKSTYSKKSLIFQILLFLLSVYSISFLYAYAMKNYKFPNAKQEQNVKIGYSLIPAVVALGIISLYPYNYDSLNPEKMSASALALRNFWRNPTLFHGKLHFILVFVVAAFVLLRAAPGFSFNENYRAEAIKKFEKLKQFPMPPMRDLFNLIEKFFKSVSPLIVCCLFFYQTGLWMHCIISLGVQYGFRDFLYNRIVKRTVNLLPIEEEIEAPKKQAERVEEGEEQKEEQKPEEMEVIKRKSFGEHPHSLQMGFWTTSFLIGFLEFIFQVPYYLWLFPNEQFPSSVAGFKQNTIEKLISLCITSMLWSPVLCYYSERSTTAPRAYGVASIAGFALEMAAVLTKLFTFNPIALNGTVMEHGVKGRYRYYGKNENLKNLFITFGGFWGVPGWLGCIFINLYILSKLAGEKAKSEKAFLENETKNAEIEMMLQKKQIDAKREVAEEKESPKDK